MDFLDELVQDLLRKVHLPENWQKDIERLVENMDVVYSEEEYECRRMKLIAERDCLTVPDGATTDEKNKILHLLFEAIYYDFDKKRMVRFKPLSEYAPIFQFAAPFSGWTEKEGFIFSVSDLKSDYKPDL